VVNASWGLTGTAGQCITEFSTDIEVLKAAGIAIAIAAGNDGPAPLTSLSPANNPSGLCRRRDRRRPERSPGFSSRGPSACDGTVYPELVAPGVDINTADLSFGGMPLYAVVSGTSYAAPHAAGAMALLAERLSKRQRRPDRSGADRERARPRYHRRRRQLWLRPGRRRTRPTSCWTPPRPPTRRRSRRMMPGACRLGRLLSSMSPGVLGNDGDAGWRSADGGAGCRAPAGGSLALNADGSFSYTPNAGFAGTDSFAYRAFDGALHSDHRTVSITVNASVNTPPLAQDDSAAAPVRKTTSYTPKVISVLANDSDPDGNLDPASVSIAAAPNKGGTVTVNADGTVSYTPKLKFRGKEIFKYTVRDQAGAPSNTATVTVSVK
jgi:hypothetical protein